MLSPDSIMKVESELQCPHPSAVQGIQKVPPMTASLPICPLQYFTNDLTHLSVLALLFHHGLDKLTQLGFVHLSR